jgi:hypothetical protein
MSSSATTGFGLVAMAKVALAVVIFPCSISACSRGSVDAALISSHACMTLVLKSSAKPMIAEPSSVRE